MNNNLKSKVYDGQCLCGQIRYQVTNLSSRMGHCHCSMCRKFHGAAFATFGEVAKRDFSWVSGEQLLRTYAAPNGTQRKFCENCGSSLIFVPANKSAEVVEFTLGTLDTPLEYYPDAHIFTQFKASWYQIQDDLPKYLGNRESSLVDKTK